MVILILKIMAKDCQKNMAEIILCYPGSIHGMKKLFQIVKSLDIAHRLTEMNIYLTLTLSDGFLYFLSDRWWEDFSWQRGWRCFWSSLLQGWHHGLWHHVSTRLHPGRRRWGRYVSVLQLYTHSLSQAVAFTLKAVNCDLVLFSLNFVLHLINI